MSINSIADDILSQLFSNRLVPGLFMSVDATYRAVTTGSLDFNTGGVNNTTVDTAIKVIRDGFTYDEVRQSDGAVQITDLKLWVRPVSGINFEDYKNDLIIMDSKTYYVKDFKREVLGPTDMVYMLQCGIVE